MTEAIRGAAVVVLFVWPLAGLAHGWGHGGRVVTAYYYPAPVLQVPISAVMPAVPCPVAVVPSAPVVRAPVLPTPAPRPLATPAPAPPSSGPVNPSSPSTPPMNQVPAVGESRALYQPTAAVTESSSRAGTEKARVGFWNLSGRDVVLRVDGRSHFLAQGTCLKLDVARTFAWKVGDYDTQVEQMPGRVASMELVIRR